MPGLQFDLPLSPAPSERNSTNTQRETKRLPRVLELSDALRYLKDHHGPTVQIDQTALDIPPTETQSLEWEHALIQDLTLIRTKADPDELDHLRALIRAVSWETHGPPKKSDLLKRLETAELSMRQEAARLTAESSVEEARKILTDFLSGPDVIRAAIQTNACGIKSAEAVQAIESLMERSWTELNRIMKQYGKTWNDVRQILETTTTTEKSSGEEAASALRAVRDRLVALRPVRDQIYFQHVYGEWCQTAPRKAA